MSTTTALWSPGRLLDALPGDSIPEAPHLSGFGGLHGGLVVALLARAMEQQAPGLPLRGITATFSKQLTGTAHVRTTVTRAGRILTTVDGAVEGPAGVHVTASAVFGPAGAGGNPVTAPVAPQAPPPDACEVFAVPPEFVPIAKYMEIRPVGPQRPFLGCPRPELTAWIRLVDDDRGPDAARLLVLLDGLAPSYAAVLTSLQAIPTVHLAVSLSNLVSPATSPWVLLHASTRSSVDDGWVSEDIDAWTPGGSYLGGARQLRVALAPRS